MDFTRFAVYYVPPEGALAQFGAAWLGWDLGTAQEVAHPDLPDIQKITKTPRKYGFHATLKPPFRLAKGTTFDELEAAFAQMARRSAPAGCAGLTLTRLGRFLALTPQGDPSGLARVAASCVQDLDRFRAAPTPEELARRRMARLTPSQDALLLRWGYPYVLEEFAFHITLTGPVPEADVPIWTTRAAEHLPALPAPFVLDSVALVGERIDGRFQLIRRAALTG